MKKTIFFAFTTFYCLLPTALVNAQTPTLMDVDIETVETPIETTTEATIAAEVATPEATLASPSAEVEEIIQKKKDEDITETGGKQKSVLAAHLDAHPIQGLTPFNPLQYLMRRAITNGLPANIVVLMLIFPIIASIVALSRHVIGMQGFGIYIPAVLSVALISTGIFTGITIFFAVIIAATIARKLIRFLKLPVLPRTAMLLLVVSTLILLVMMVAALFKLETIITVNIFPVLIIILLTENFMSTQLFTSQKESFRIMIETLVVALTSSLIVGSESVQKFIILRPEITLIVIAILNWLIGRYTGLRVLEYFRFKGLLGGGTGSGTVLNLPPDDHETPEE